MIPINLGQSAAQIGLAQALAQQPQQQRRVVGDPKAPQYGASARNYGLAEALQPIEVTSGGWGEALAEALAGGLRGRAAQSERQQAVDAEQWDRNQAEKTQGARNSAISEALQGFDPANPQGMVGALSQGAPEEALGLATALAGRQPPAPEWQLDPVTGQPFAITPQGQVQYGEGRVNVRQSGAADRAPPAGYRWTPDGNMEAVPGGPADVRAGESAQRNRRFYETAIRNRENVLQSINNARSQASGWTTGVAGQVLGAVGGTAAHDLQSEVDTIIANIGFEALQEMRANSQTGGALGQVAVRELEMLQSTIASLRISQSREQFQRNLSRVEQQYNTTLRAYQAALEELSQAPGSAPAEPYVQDGQQQDRVLQWSPERGVY